MSCRHPRRGATEILLAGSSAPCHPVVAVAESYTNSTSWSVAGCWSQCPGSCHLRRMKNPIPGRRAWGSHLRVLLGPQALWRLTRPAGLQRLHLPSVRGNAGPSHIWVPRFLPPHLNVYIRLERVRQLRRKPDDCVHQEASEKNNWKRQSAIPTAIPATILCKTSATPERQRPSASAAHGTVW